MMNLVWISFVLFVSYTHASEHVDKCMYNYLGVFGYNNRSREDIPSSIYLATEYDVTVSLVIPFLSPASRLLQTFNLSANESRRLLIPSSVRMPPTSLVSTRSVLVKATKPLSVIFVNNQTSNEDGVQIRELRTLGLDYVVPSFHDRLAGAFVHVAAPFDSTLVRVTLPAGSAPIRVNVRGRNVVTSSNLTLTLNALEALQLQSSGDLTGTVVWSDKRVAVFSGHNRTYAFGQCLDYMVEQVPKLSELGSEFVIYLPFPGSEKELLTLVAIDNSTRIRLDGGSAFEIAQAHQFAQVTLTRRSVHHVISDRPLVAAVFTFSGIETDASMLIVDSVPFTGSKYVFSVPVMNNLKVTIAYELVLIIREGCQGQITLNGYKLSSGVVWKTSAHTSYVATSITLSLGDKANVVETDLSEPFGAYVLAYAKCRTISFRLAPMLDANQCRYESRYKRHLNRKLVCRRSLHVRANDNMGCHVICRTTFGENCIGFNLAKTRMDGRFDCEMCVTKRDIENSEQYDMYLPYT